MKVLFVSAAAAPADGSHATRVSAFIDALFIKGATVTLLTNKWPSSMYESSVLYERLEMQCHMVRVSGGLFRNVADAARQGRSGHGLVGSVKWLKRFFSQLRRWGRKCSFPDSFMTWVPGAIVRGIGCVDDEDSTVVVSSGAPFSSHIVGAVISVIKRVPLILDYGDPWVYEPGWPRSGLRLLLERSLERWIVAHAAAILVTTAETASLYVEKFGVPRSLIYVVPMGFDPNDYFCPESLHFDSRQVIDCIYAGRMTHEYRSFSGLKHMLGVARRDDLPVRIGFYGSDHARVESELEAEIRSGIVEVYGNLDHKDYIELLVGAGALLIFGNNNYIQIPGKIAHYVAARRPVMYFPNVDDLSKDPSLRLLKKVIREGLFVMCTGTDIIELVQFVFSGKPMVYDETELERLSWESIGLQFNKIVESCMAQS